jgi:hypothetical protein
MSHSGHFHVLAVIQLKEIYSLLLSMLLSVGISLNRTCLVSLTNNRLSQPVNLIEQGFQHRDISIGNVLWLLQDQVSVRHFSGRRQRSSARWRLKMQLKQSDVNEHCRGFVIDGDMAIEFKSYFTEAHEGSRSVRCQPFLHLMVGC